MTTRGWPLAAAVLAAACATSQGGRGGDDACRPTEGRLAVTDSAVTMRGEYRLTMRATSGAASGHAAIGRLSLVPQETALLAAERSTEPLRGTADIRLEDIGATRMGDLAAGDPADPGVGVYEQRAPSGAPTVVVRLGSGSNGRGPSAMDAGHTTLFVGRIGSDGFGGSWSSSAGSTFPPRRSGGFFCAVRIPS